MIEIITRISRMRDATQECFRASHNNIVLFCLALAHVYAIYYLTIGHRHVTIIVYIYIYIRSGVYITFFGGGIICKQIIIFFFFCEGVSL
jgi:hypothetical protein